MKLRFTGDTAAVLLTKQPSYFIVAVKPGEVFDVPDDVAASLLMSVPKLERVSADDAPRARRRANYITKGE